MKRRILSVLVCAIAPAVSAVPVTFNFTGNVTNIASGSGTFGAPWNTSPAVIGSPVSVSYTFESSTPDSNGTSYLGVYANLISSCTVTINAATSTFTPTSSATAVYENFPAGIDQHETQAHGVPGAYRLVLDLEDWTNQIFTTDALPTNLAFNYITNTQGRLEAASGPFVRTVYFNITSFSVPEPTGALTAAGTLFGLARRRR